MVMRKKDAVCLQCSPLQITQCLFPIAVDFYSSSVTIHHHPQLHVRRYLPVGEGGDGGAGPERTGLQRGPVGHLHAPQAHSQAPAGHHRALVLHGAGLWQADAPGQSCDYRAHDCDGRHVLRRLVPGGL